MIMSVNFQPNDKLIKDELTRRLLALEKYLNADVMSYTGVIDDGIPPKVKGVIENLASSKSKKDTLYIILTTTGGSANAVDIYVNILRHHYTTVNFIIPEYAYSAGTIFCMSGDNIYMDYYSVLGPIDPQVQNKEGRWVAALGYLDKVNELLVKASNRTLTNAEFIILKEMDLAELKGYEQARDLTIDLLKKWLVKYKFKNWATHGTTPALLGQPVTPTQKETRAEEIGKELANTSKWKSHGRPINLQALTEMRLKIEDFGSDATLKKIIPSYYEFLRDYTNKIQMTMPPELRSQFNFLHTRTFI